MTSPYLRWGLGTDPTTSLALALALVSAAVAAWPAARSRIQKLPRSWLLFGLGLGAALLSIGYVAHYLRGGPRIIDATAYFLEARTFSRGIFSFPLAEPTASFRGRFLLPTPDGRGLSVIFPPGYPALLALGFLARAPLLVGPIIALCLVPATYWLTREFTGREDAARLSATISALCAALRYHTADTMSHGWSALLFTLALAAAARGKRYLWLSGLALGWLLATRPLSGLVALALCSVVALRHRARVLTLIPGLVPGLALLVLYNRATTGAWLGSAQSSYYLLADGPPGCFKYGFGPNVGCRFEHGEYVRSLLASGYGPLEALRVTGRRLAVHCLDVANFAPLSWLVPLICIRRFREPGVWVLGAGVLGIVLAYAGFYFDGSYPGGGARFYADVLPLEHALLACALLDLGIGRFAPAFMLAGFALHASHAHEALAEREGGRPMFEEAVLERNHVRSGIVYVSTDHGFLLGHDPRDVDAWQRPLIVRERDDENDLLLWERAGRPAAYRYRYDALASNASASLEPFEPIPTNTMRFEAEAQWPVLHIEHGYAHPDYSAAPCVSQGRGLRLVATDGAPLRVELELLAQHPGAHELRVQWVSDDDAALIVEVMGQTKTLAAPARTACRTAGPIALNLTGQARVTLSTKARSVLLDYLEVENREGK